MIVGIGILYGGLFNADLRTYLPYLAASLITWNYMSQSILDCCNAFIDASGVIKQMPSPRTTFVFKVIYRNLIYLAHNVIVVVGVFLLFQTPVNWNSALFFLLAPLFFANVGWMGLVAAIVCTRFRDAGPITANAIQLLFFLTPVMWQPALLPERLSFVAANPFYHLMETVREPLLGFSPSVTSVITCLVMAILGWAAAIMLLGRVRKRIVFWV